jgi:hypothetical protein
MTWTADQVKRRTYDVDAGLELFYLSGGSDGTRYFEIRGNDLSLHFSASKIDAPATANELAALGLREAMVWCVSDWTSHWSAEQQSLIVEALCATKSGHGFTIRGEPFFVRFGLKGELRHA